MPKGQRGEKRPRDPNQLAKRAAASVASRHPSNGRWRKRSALGNRRYRCADRERRNPHSDEARALQEAGHFTLTARPLPVPA